ncbi:NUDIX domain-containing protein [Oceanibacterium hippocampi]|uniref:ADP-ribose pyrophosphatase n=1 Tax=Oceanibacterium hippocampi TaxID=745714 RepID=A0A1Y5TB27_9PROT|nr:NUDIX hydrolase [Oceanibacterium hippocampi]SLN59924.1 GDP-mannose pyrophosphatase NudK [Oceanibacterium hippocampi]
MGETGSGRRYTIHDRSRLLDGFLPVDTVSVSFERFDGGFAGPMERRVLMRGDAAAAVLYNPSAGTVVLAEQFRVATVDGGSGWLVEIPAGMIDAGEEAEATMRREILEETGYRVGALESWGWYFASPGGSAERVHMFYGEIGSGDRVAGGGGLDHEHEDIRLIEPTLAEVWRMLDNGSILDAKTLIGLQGLRLRLAGAG